MEPDGVAAGFFIEHEFKCVAAALMIQNVSGLSHWNGLFLCLQRNVQRLLRNSLKLQRKGLFLEGVRCSLATSSFIGKRSPKTGFVARCTP
jgi:hypothetical protein